MPVPPTGHSSSIDSTSSYGSSKSSLLAPPIDPVSSQSDIADPTPPFMPRGSESAYAVAASPSQAVYKANNPAASAGQKFKRAFGKRRRPSQDATSILSSGDERSASDAAPVASSSGVVHSSSNRPSAAKLTMHLFGGRKPAQGPHTDPNQPPPLPPKPPGMRTPPSALQIPAGTTNKLSASGARPRSSVMVTSPSINAALEFMREDEERQIADGQRRQHPPSQELEQNKEDWRKSDSTVASGHTVRPSRQPESAQGPNPKRRSTLLTPQNGSGDALGLDFTSGAQASAADAAGDPSTKQAKRRSLSLNIHVAPRQMSAPVSSDTAVPTYTYTPPPSSLRIPISSRPESHSTGSPSHDPGSLRGSHSPNHTVSLSPASHDIPTLSHTAANGIIGSGTASGSPVNRTNIRGRLAAWTATSASRGRSPSPLGAMSTSTPSLSSPSATSFNNAPHRRVPVTSTPSQPPPDLQAIAAVRDIQSRTRTPSASGPGAAGIRQAATLASGASAMAFGFGKRAYEKVGRVWAGAGSGTGSGSDTPSSQYSNAGVASSGDEAMHPPQHHAPSAFPAHARRTQNAPSGTWSVSSLSGGSRSSSERDPAGGRETPPSGPGRMVRRPRSAGGGSVFGRQLWECVRETRAAVPPDHPLGGRMIPALVLRCAEHLHKWGIQEEGLFRISGRSSHINRLRHEFDSGADYDIIDCSPSELDPHAVASLFKAYLRELPEPVLTRALGPLFDTAMNAESSRVTPTTPTSYVQKTIAGSGPGLPSGPRAIPMIRKPPSLSTFTLPTSNSLRAPSASLVEALGDLVARLPRENRDLLWTVVDLMRATAAQSKETKMPLSNLLLVFCPSLSMSPTLLRVLCDSAGVWERAREPPVVDIAKPPAAMQDEGEESDETDSDSNSVSSYGEEAQVVELPRMYKGAEAEETPAGEDTQFDVAGREATPSEDNDPLPRTESPVSMPLDRPHVVRRVPVPVLNEEPSQQTSPYSSRSFTPPPHAVPLPQSASPSASASSQSLHVPTRSMTPLSAVSLTSAPALESTPMVPPLRSRQFSSPFPSSGYVAPLSWGALDQNKDLPASPRTPGFDARATSTPPLAIATEALPVRKSSRPLPLIPPSHSAPSVVFPTAKTPTTPTSLKKHALSFSVGRQGRLSSDDERSPPPSPSRLPVRRPSLNMLFNMKRGGSPSPRSRTPTISSPLSISAPLPQTPTVDSSPRTVTNLFPPVLSLPLDAGADAGLGLGWDDVFGKAVTEAALVVPPQPRPTAISQPSSQLPPFEPPPSPSRRPTTEFLLSSGGFFSASGPPLALPSPTSVLEAASLPPNVHAAYAHDNDAEAAVVQDDSSSGPDSPEVDSPVKDVFTPPPHLSFQLRRSSMEEEDWASAVLMAAGKPTEPLA